MTPKQKKVLDFITGYTTRTGLCPVPTGNRRGLRL